MKPVLLTGATGFIGIHLQGRLSADGHSVLAVVRPASANRHALLNGTDCLLADLTDPSALAPAISTAQAVIYCAGSVRGRSLDDFKAANVTGVRSIVDAMNQAATGAPLLLISSLAASRPHVSDYAYSKHLGEQEVITHATFPWTIFRPPAVYGPGDREMLPILKLARKGLVTPAGPIDQRLSLLHADDLAAAGANWLKAWEKCDHQVFTLDDGHAGGYQWHEIATAASGGRYIRLNLPRWLISGAGYFNLALSRLIGYSPMLTPGKARELTQTDWVCNNTPFSEATGWSPEISLEQGLLDLFTKP